MKARLEEMKAHREAMKAFLGTMEAMTKAGQEQMKAKIKTFLDGSHRVRGHSRKDRGCSTAL